MAETRNYDAEDYINPAYWDGDENIHYGKRSDFFSGRRKSRKREIKAGAVILNEYFKAGGKGFALDGHTIGQPFDAASYGHGAVVRVREETLVREKGYPVDLSVYDGVDPPPRYNPIDDFEIELYSEQQGATLAFGSFVYWGVIVEPWRGGPRFNTYLPTGLKKNGQIKIEHLYELMPSFTVGETLHVTKRGDHIAARITDLHVCSIGMPESERRTSPFPGPLGRPQET